MPDQALVVQRPVRIDVMQRSSGDSDVQLVNFDKLQLEFTSKPGKGYHVSSTMTPVGYI